MTACEHDRTSTGFCMKCGDDRGVPDVGRIAQMVVDRHAAGAYPDLRDQIAEVERKAAAGEITGIPVHEFIDHMKAEMAKRFPAEEDQ